MEQISLIKRNGTTVKLFSKEPFRTVKQASQSKTLMGVDTVTLSIISRDLIAFAKGDKIQVNGEDYFIRTAVNRELLPDNSFKYDVVLYGVLYDLMKTPYRDMDSQGKSSRNTFDLIYTLKQFVRVIINNTNVDYPSLWAFDETGCPDVDPKQMQFSCNNCLEALQNICKEFEVDFRITQSSGVRTIHIGSFGNQITPPDGSEWFEWGRGKGLYSLKEEKVDDKSVKTRIWVEGGTENIPSGYRGYSERLQLPLLYPDPEHPTTRRQNKNAHTLSDGTVIAANSQYIGIADENSRYIEDAALSQSLGVDAEQKQYDDIKPTRTGTVTAIVSGDVNSFIDTSMSFDLNEKVDGKTVYLIDGTSAKITFIDGLLAGQQFELHKYDHSTKKFTVKPYQDNRGLVFPTTDTTAFRISAGDKYKITDIVMPQDIIDDAEEDLWYKGYDDLLKDSQPRVQYGLSLNRMRLLETTEEDADQVLFSPGDYVPVKDTRFGVQKTIRIQKVDRNLLLRQDYTLTISDTTTINIISQTVVDVQEHNAIITLNGLRDFGRARRGWRTTEELRNMVFDTDGYFDTDNFRANSIDTNMLTVGSKSQQFILVGVVIEPNKDGNGNKFAVSAGQLVHLTINEDNPVTWNMTAYSATFSTTAARYLYAKCSKSGSTGVFLVSTTKYKFEPSTDANNYYFLVGIIGSLKDGWRDFQTTYGFTRINGNTITTGKIVSEDGECYLDLDGNRFRIGSTDDNSWIDWNVTANKRLTLHNVDVLSDSGDTNPIGVYRGVWEEIENVLNVVFYKNDEVSYTSNGATATYRYINNTPSKGHLPTNTTYWAVVAKGKDGSPGSPGSPGLTPVLHIRYSNDGGQTFTANNGKTPGEYIGMYSDYTQADSTNVGDYVWYKFKGEDGLPGTSHTLVDLDNENDSVLYTEGGTRITDFPVSHAYLFVGKNQIKGDDLNDASWTITGDGNCSFRYDPYYEGSTLVGMVIYLTGWVSGNQAAITVACTYNGATSVDVFTIKKLVGVDKWELVVTPNAVSYDPNHDSSSNGYSHDTIKAQCFVTDQKNSRQEKTNIRCIRYTCSNGNSGTMYGGGTVTTSTFSGSTWVRFDLYKTYADAYNQTAGAIQDSETVSIVSGGEDGETEEKVFKRTKVNIKPAAPSDNSQTPDYIPSGWTDDPTGVDAEYPYEWVSIRTKTAGTWGNFQTPTIWQTFASLANPNLLEQTEFESANKLNMWHIKSEYSNKSGYTHTDEVSDHIAEKYKDGRNAYYDRISYDSTEVNYKELLAQYVWKKDGSIKTLENGKWYTLSFWVRNYGTRLAVYLYTGVSGEYAFDNTQSIYVDGIEVKTNGQNVRPDGTIMSTAKHNYPGSDMYFAFDSGSSIVKHTITFKTRSAYSSSYRFSTDWVEFLFRMLPPTSSGNANICMIKLEEGMMATAYAPNPEDLHAYYYEYRYKKNGSKSVAPDMTGNVFDYAEVAVPTGWTTDQPSVGNLEYLWQIVAKKWNNGTLVSAWSKPLRITPYDGVDGDSPAAVFRGVFDEAKVYVGTPYRVDVVKYNGVYYVTRKDAGTFNGSAYLPTDTSKWNTFGAQFDSIATGLLLAEMANIANWIFKDSMMISQRGTLNGVESDEYDNANFIPNIFLDAIHGEIRAGRYMRLDNTGLTLLNGSGKSVATITNESIVNKIDTGASSESGTLSQTVSYSIYLPTQSPGYSSGASPCYFKTLGVMTKDSTIQFVAATMAATFPSSVGNSSLSYSGYYLRVRLNCNGREVKRWQKYSGSGNKYVSDTLTINETITVDGSTYPEGNYTVYYEIYRSFTSSGGSSGSSSSFNMTLSNAYYAYNKPIDKKLIIGNDGLFNRWSDTNYLVSSTNGFITRFGSYLLRVTNSGIQKSTDGGSTWTNL